MPHLNFYDVDSLRVLFIPQGSRQCYQDISFVINEPFPPGIGCGESMLGMEAQTIKASIPDLHGSRTACHYSFVTEF